MKTNKAIECTNISKTYNRGGLCVPVLKDLDISITQGEFVSIMGPSGSGKSTLLYLIGALEAATSGDILVNGKNITCMNDDEASSFRRNEIGFIFQAYNLVDSLSVEDNILVPYLLERKLDAKGRTKLRNLLTAVGLTGRKHHTPKELSGGQQQRAAIARALINDPDIILADEPVGNLDSESGANILSLLQTINREMGKTIVMVTHSEESTKYGTRVIRLKDGCIA